jgi:thymidine kinase
MAKLYFYYASMNAGKSTTLLQADFNYRERGMETMLYTAAIDDRIAKGVIASRIGLQIGGRLYDGRTDLRAEVEEELKKRKLHCILLDEAQFLTHAQVVQLASICDELDIPVLAYGLRTDFQANLFEGSAHLLALADTLVELKAVCDCGRKATMNLRVDEDGRPVSQGKSIEIGGNDRYISLCRRHFMDRIAEVEGEQLRFALARAAAERVEPEKPIPISS